MGQESARHGPRRYCGRDHCFKLLDLARTKGNLCGWGRGLWRWGAMLGEPHDSCPLGSWTLLGPNWRLKEMRRSWASWVAGMLGMQAFYLLECWVELFC
ncbi:hypothetical protein ACFX13_022061 [Malus domestica]